MDKTMAQAVAQAHIRQMEEALQEPNDLWGHIHSISACFEATQNGFEVTLAPPGGLSLLIDMEINDEHPDGWRVNPNAMELVLPDEGSAELINVVSNGQRANVTLSAEQYKTLQRYAATAWTTLQDYEDQALVEYNEDNEGNEDNESDQADAKADEDEDLIGASCAKMMNCLKQGMYFATRVTDGQMAKEEKSDLTLEDGIAITGAMAAAMYAEKALGALGDRHAKRQIYENNRKEHIDMWDITPHWAREPHDYAKRAAELALPVFEEIHMAAENPAKDIRPSPSPYDGPPASEGKDLAQCLREMGQVLNAVHAMAKNATLDLNNHRPPQQAVIAAIETVRTMACLALQLEPFLTTDEDRLNASSEEAPRPIQVGPLQPEDFIRI